jgi:hypothetical protein
VLHAQPGNGAARGSVLPADSQSAAGRGEDEQVPGGAEIEAEEFADMPPLESGAKSEESEYANLPPLNHEQYEQERRVGVPSVLADQGGQDFTPERAIVRQRYPYDRKWPDTWAVMHFEPRAPMVVPPTYKVVRMLDPWAWHFNPSLHLQYQPAGRIDTSAELVLPACNTQFSVRC